MKWPEELMFMKNSRAKQNQSNETMENKLSIISGATSGVGLSSLYRFAKAGSDLVMVCRNQAKAEAIKADLTSLYPVNVDIVIADFEDLDSVRNAASEILEKYPKIDVLVNSVGIHSTKRKYTKAGFELVFCVNHLSTFLFTMLLLERIKQTPYARIIQVNSEGHRFQTIHLNDVAWRKHIYTGLKSYGASKTAQIYTVYKIAEMLKDTSVTINAMHPGAVKTNIGSNNGWLYRFFLHHFTWHFLKDPHISGDAMHYLATSKELEKVSGKFFNLTILETPARHANKPELIQPVFDLSMELVGLK